MGVPSEVLEYLFGSSEWRLGKNDPIRALKGLEARCPSCWVSELTEVAFKDQLSVLEGLPQVVEKLSAEDLAEDLYMDEEILARADPFCSVGRNSTPRNHAMHMRVQIQFLPPAVEDSKESDLSAKMLWIPRNFEKGFRDGAKKEAVHQALVLECYWAEFIWKGEDNVKVPRLEEIRCLSLKPFRSSLCLALRAVAIAAGLVEEFLMTALVTSLHLATESSSSANGNISQDALLIYRNAVRGEIGTTVLPENIGHFEPMGYH